MSQNGETEQRAPVGSLTTTHLRSVKYGPDSIQGILEIMEDILPKDSKPKALILTGKSLAKTPVIPDLEKLLKSKDAYAGTFTKMRQHSPIDDIEEALNLMRENSATLLIGVGGGGSSILSSEAGMKANDDDAANLRFIYRCMQDNLFLPQ